VIAPDRAPEGKARVSPDSPKVANLERAEQGLVSRTLATAIVSAAAARVNAGVPANRGRFRSVIRTSPAVSTITGVTATGTISSGKVRTEPT